MSKQRDALAEAIAGVKQFLPEEAVKALDADEEAGGQEDASMGDEEDAGAGAPAATTGQQPTQAEVAKGQGDDSADEVAVAEVEAADLFNHIGREVAKGVAKGVARFEKSVLARLARLEKAAVAGLEVHKSVGHALNLAARRPAATPPAPGAAASTLPPPNGAGARHTGGGQERRLDFEEVMKAVDDGLISAPEGTVYQNTGNLPRGLTPNAVRQQIAAR